MKKHLYQTPSLQAAGSRTLLSALAGLMAPAMAAVGLMAPLSAHAGTGLPSQVSTAAAVLLAGLAVVLCIYAVRQYVFGLNRLFSPQRRTFEGLQQAQWPRLTVFIAAHNEEAVVGGCIEALLKADYPKDRLLIVPVNDRSKDRTKEICDQWAAQYPELVRPFHRTGGKAGKPAALMDAANFAPATDVYVIFDADYLPGTGLLKQIVAPFLDPEVGVTMGRVVPTNASVNFLTRLLDLERSAGYQGDQQARQNLKAMPQFGGTVGGIRASALQAVGGFREDVLAEDTDLTFRLLDKGWKVHYVNSAECYEEVPEAWPVRVRQLQRWAKGHNQVMFHYLRRTLFNRFLSPRQRLDSALLLLCYAVAPLTLAGWLLVLLGYLAEPGWSLALASSVLALVVYGGFGNSSAFYQMAGAVRLDGKRERLKLLPFNFVGYIVSAVTITRGMLNLMLDAVLKRELKWDKTVRYRAKDAQAPGQSLPAPGTTASAPLTASADTPAPDALLVEAYFKQSS